jgi:hypothetical protein
MGSTIIIGRPLASASELVSPPGFDTSTSAAKPEPTGQLQYDAAVRRDAMPHAAQFAVVRVEKSG